MNGRVYDPELGRFMSADPFVQAPYNTQSYNRYSYVFNNPLSFTDPNGYQARTVEDIHVPGRNTQEDLRRQREQEREDGNRYAAEQMAREYIEQMIAYSMWERTFSTPNGIVRISITDPVKAVAGVSGGAQESPTFFGALADKEFWSMYGQGVKDLGLATGKMLLGEASMYSGWILSKVPGGQVTGGYLMVDGASLFAGGMSDVSNLFYGTSVDYDVVGRAYRNAGEVYFGNAGYGDIARSTVGLGSIFRANTIPVLTIMNSSAWGNSALTYTTTVPAFYTSNNVIRAADAVGVVQGVRGLEQ